MFQKHLPPETWNRRFCVLPKLRVLKTKRLRPGLCQVAVRACTCCVEGEKMQNTLTKFGRGKEGIRRTVANFKCGDYPGTFTPRLNQSQYIRNVRSKSRGLRLPKQQLRDSLRSSRASGNLLANLVSSQQSRVEACVSGIGKSIVCSRAFQRERPPALVFLGATMAV